MITRLFEAKPVTCLRVYGNPVKGSDAKKKWQELKINAPKWGLEKFETELDKYFGPGAYGIINVSSKLDKAIKQALSDGKNLVLLEEFPCGELSVEMLYSIVCNEKEYRKFHDV
jgi:sulfite reductase beta subunit-like hemoprotein